MILSSPMRRAVAASAAILSVGLAAGAYGQDSPAPVVDIAVPASTTTAPSGAVESTDPVIAGDAATDAGISAPPTAPIDRLPAGTVIEIRVDEAVNSKTHKTGDWYAISLSQPIKLGDAILIPAGTTGRGQVVHSAKSGWGGKAGELILAARYLDYQGRQIALRGMKLGGVGGNNEGLAFAASVAGGLVAMPLVFALNGKNADIAAGTLATAKLTADMIPESLPVAATAADGATVTADSAAAVTPPAPEDSPVATPGEKGEEPIKQEDI